MNTNVKEWYIKEHPEDEDVRRYDLIKDGVTFGDVWDALKERKNIYDVLGCESPTVRHSVFYELALKAGVSYDTIYSMYLEKNRTPYFGNRDNGTYSYLVAVPVEGVLEISGNASNEADLAFQVYDKLKESNFGALRNIDTKIENLTDSAAIETLINYLKDNSLGKTGDKCSVISYPVRGDVLLSIKAVTAEDAVNKVLKAYDSIKNKITSDKSVCGDLKDLVFFKEKIKEYTDKTPAKNINKKKEYDLCQA